MSDTNGNGVTPVVTPVFMPGLNGGMLRRGGLNPKHNGGPTPRIIRDGFRKDLPATARRMRARCREIEALIVRRKLIHGDDTAALLGDQERLMRAEETLADFLAKYGLGTTITETDTQGNDVPRGRYTPDERRAALLQEFSSA